jgi:acyl-CoA synthetase (AMP-forming)/AMP-acid ligase II
MPTLQEVEARLAEPGGPYETVEEPVGGRRIRVFRHRARSLTEILRRSERFGDAELMVWDDGRRFSFREHLRAAASTAAALRERYGIRRGERVALLGANSPEWIVGLWGTLALGGIAVGMNGWWTADEIRYGLELTEPKLLIADRRRLARLEGADPGVPTLVIEDDFAALWNHESGAALPEVPIDEDDPAVILFTSGTTGRPKGAIATHRNLIAFLDMMAYSNVRTSLLHGLPISDDARMRGVSLQVAPLFHVSGLQSAALGNVYNGTKAVWVTGRFDPEKVFRLTLEEGVTRWSAVTTHLWRMLEHPKFGDYDFSQVRSIGGGGSVWSPELQRLIREKLPHAGAAMVVGYGLTESGGLATIATNEILLEHPDSVGRALPGVEVEIHDDAGRRLPDGVEGNICLRGAMVMPGYWRNPQATAETLSPDGWLKTGDIGQLRGDLLFLASRKRDMIIRGGENVYPVEIENRLEEHPGVLEAAVVGVDHRELGQEVKAVVVPRAGARLDPEQIRAFVAEKLAYYKVPGYVEIRREPLPRNATGKVLKNVLTGEARNTFVEE